MSDPDHNESSRRLPNPALILGLAVLTAVLGIVDAVLVARRWPPLMELDKTVDGSLHRIGESDPWFVDPAYVFHWLGTPVVVTPIIVVVVLGLAIFRHFGWAAMIAACAILGVIVSETVKHLVDRPRPEWSDPFVVETGGSFPSGHSMVGVYGWAMFGVAALYLLPRAWACWIGWPLIIFGLLFAPSRLVLGVHWPSDVVGGWLLGAAVALSVSGVAILIARRQLPRQ
ncbi:MAG: phosphatase PAP2 family protein [Candidatus Nanopelagicales bacterium]|nr:phosphatase PAP2 family protein [Candidatus Nanopelagicales bacterium]